MYVLSLNTILHADIASQSDFFVVNVCSVYRYCSPEWLHIVLMITRLLRHLLFSFGTFAGKKKTSSKTPNLMAVNF